jgi:hypothetical protein
MHIKYLSLKQKTKIKRPKNKKIKKTALIKSVETIKGRYQLCVQKEIT